MRFQTQVTPEWTGILSASKRHFSPLAGAWIAILSCFTLRSERAPQAILVRNGTDPVRRRSERSFRSLSSNL